MPKMEIDTIELPAIQSISLPPRTRRFPVVGSLPWLVRQQLDFLEDARASLGDVYTLDLGLTLLQWNAESLKLAFGGGSVATTAGPPAYYTYTPPAPEDIDFRAVVLEWEDGTKDYRLHVPKALVTDTSSITLARSDAAGIPLTLSVIATDGTDPFTIITNDPAFA